MANMTSVKLKILQTMQTFFAEMQADLPINDPYGITWDAVRIGPLAKMDHRRKFSLGISAGQDKVQEYKYPLVQRLLPVHLEIRVTVQQDDEDPGVMIEEAITVVERGAVQDRSWGGLAIDTKIIMNESDLITYADRSAVAVVEAQVQYRHGYNDPRNPNPVL